MKDRDCEYESEGYCDKKEKFLNPQECKDCKMHEFTLHSATKYKDGTPIYAEPNGLTIGAVSDVLVRHTAKQKELSNQLDSLEQRVDDLSEEYDAVLKTHGDTLEQLKNQIEDIYKEYDIIFENQAKRVNMIAGYLDEYLDRICNLEHLYEQLISKFCAIEQHKGSDFCGNCIHSNIPKLKDDVYICELSGEIVDPDSASCSMFEPPF